VSCWKESVAGLEGDLSGAVSTLKASERADDFCFEQEDALLKLFDLGINFRW
jgi:hypothetical protein